MSTEALAHFRDMSHPCPRCGAAPGVACHKWRAVGLGLEFVFPCGTTEEHARAVLREGVEQAREMALAARSGLPRGCADE